MASNTVQFWHGTTVEAAAKFLRTNSWFYSDPEEAGYRGAQARLSSENRVFSGSIPGYAYGFSVKSSLFNNHNIDNEGLWSLPSQAKSAALPRARSAAVCKDSCYRDLVVLKFEVSPHRLEPDNSKNPPDHQFGSVAMRADFVDLDFLKEIYTYREYVPALRFFPSTYVDFEPLNWTPEEKEAAIYFREYLKGCDIDRVAQFFGDQTTNSYKGPDGIKEFCKEYGIPLWKEKSLKGVIEEHLDKIYYQSLEVSCAYENVANSYISEKDIDKNPWPIKEYETTQQEFFDEFETVKAEILELVEEV